MRRKWCLAHGKCTWRNQLNEKGETDGAFLHYLPLGKVFCILVAAYVVVPVLRFISPVGGSALEAVLGTASSPVRRALGGRFRIGTRQQSSKVNVGIDLKMIQSKYPRNEYSKSVKKCDYLGEPLAFTVTFLNHYPNFSRPYPYLKKCDWKGGILPPDSVLSLHC